MNCLKYVFLPFLILTIASLKLSAQLPDFTLEVTPSHSTCLQNGALNWTTTGTDENASLTYTVTRLSDGIILVQDTTENNFEGLLPGIYEVEAVQTLGADSNSEIANATILNEYVELTYDIEIVDDICGGSGEINLNILSGEFESVELVSGPITIGPLMTPMIGNLVAGDYIMHVVDTCGVVDVTSLSIEYLGNELSITNNLDAFFEDLPCDEIRVRYGIYPIDGSVISFPLTINYIVHPPTELGLPDTTITQYVPSGYIYGLVNWTDTIPFYGNEYTYTYDVEILDNCGETFTKFENTVEVNPYINTIPYSKSCNMGFRLNATRIRYPYEVKFLSHPPGFDSIALNINHPGPFYSRDMYYESTTISAPEGDYTIRVVGLCDSIEKSFTLIEPTFDCWNQTIGFGTGCEEGYGHTRVVWNSELDSVKIIDAPSAYSDLNPLPNDVTNFIQPALTKAISMNNLPGGDYTFEAKDSCGVYQQCSVSIPGYVDSSFVYSTTPYCGKFDLYIDHSSNYYQSDHINGTINPNYYLLKKDTSDMSWKFSNGHVYNPNTYYQWGHSYIENKATETNIFDSGEFAVLRSTRFITNGGDPSGLVQTCNKIVGEFSYFDDGLSFDSLYVLPCNEGLFSASAIASGVEPLTYRITMKDNVPFSVGDSTSPIFNDLTEGVYLFEVEDPCGNIKNRELEINSISDPEIIADNFCEGEEGRLEINGYDFLDFQWWKNDDPGTILSDSSALVFDSFSFENYAGSYSVQLSYAGTSTCIDGVLEYEIPAMIEGPNAGVAFDSDVCVDSLAFDLFDFLVPPYDAGGSWQELSSSESLSGSVWTVSGLNEGFYSFKYNVVGECYGSDSTIINLNLISDCGGCDCPAGIHCWDINGNGVNDPSEDKNNDGLYTAEDCQGEAGVQGMMGPQGPQGIQGVQGIQGTQGSQGVQGIQGMPGINGVNGKHCWDTNSNGVNDLAEDINGDGAFSVEDCIGPIGPQGIQGPIGNDGESDGNGIYAGDGITPSNTTVTITDVLNFDGDIALSGQILALSDERLKIEKTRINNALVLLNALSPTRYKFDVLKYQKLNLPERLQYGLLAQEVEMVLPEIVSEVYFSNGEKYKTINYDALIALLVGAVNEQEMRIDGLESELKEIKRELKKDK